MLINVGMHVTNENNFLHTKRTNETVTCCCIKTRMSKDNKGCLTRDSKRVSAARTEKRLASAVVEDREAVLSPPLSALHLRNRREHYVQVKAGGRRVNI